MRRLFALWLFTGGLLCPALQAQLNCASSGSSGKLICLAPTNLNFPAGSNLFTFLSEAAGSELSSVPLASPASGVIYTNDPKLNLPVPSNETLGPILTQRSETIGRHKIYIAGTYQFFRFEDIDGLSLKQVPIFLQATTPVKVFIPTNNRFDLTANQVAGYFTYGLTSRIDVSVAVPILNVHELLTTKGTEYSVTNTNAVSFSQQSPLEGATGIGDIVLAAKGTLWKPAHGGMAFGTEVRLPTGDAMNFLGSGTIGVKPYISWTLGGRFSPHANFSYQMNGESLLAANALGDKGHLTNRLFYSGGADWRVTPWMTLAGDALAQRVFKGPHVNLVQDITISNPNITASSITVTAASYNRIDGSFGVKFKPLSNLIITANLLVKLDQGGLRARTVPLGGLSFTF